MPDSIKELNKKNFDDFISKGNAIVDFWAEWCGPCKMMKPVFDDAAREFKGKIKFGKVDIEEGREIAERFEVMSIPTLIFFKDGVDVERSSGAMDKKHLLKLIESTF